jgi:phosphoglycerate dehydrogenase-like enzyme
VSAPDVLVLDPDAALYRPLLEDVTRAGGALSTAMTTGEARDRYNGQEVLLAQPDLAADLLHDLPQVRWVQSTWAGVTPLLALRRDDFILTGIREIFGPQMAEYVLGYLLLRELRVLERLGRQANRNWWQQPSGSLQGKVLGVMGTGSIGGCIARMAGQFGMELRGFNRGGELVEGFASINGRDGLQAFLRGLDYLVCVLPDTPETRHLLNAEAFAAMPDHCYLVNVGRGNVVDEAALLEALTAETIAGAVLDVFEHEPLPPESGLWHAPNLLVTAHVAAQSRPRDIAGVFSENYRRYVAGEALLYRIDFEKGY